MESRQLGWERRATELHAFALAMGRMPRRTVEGVLAEHQERALFDWTRRQRKAELQLTDDQRARLERIPGFAWAPLDELWTDRHQRVIEFRMSHGRLPRRRATKADERTLGDWINRQRVAARQNRLPHWRAEAIRSLLGYAARD